MQTQPDKDLEQYQRNYYNLLARFEAVKGANNDAIAQLLAGHHTQALKDLQRGNRICAGGGK